MTFHAERYPADWPAIRASILQRADDACECTGECDSTHAGGRCSAPNRSPVLRMLADPARWVHASMATAVDAAAARPGPAVYIVLTVAHLNHVEADNRPENLRALCQRCHLRLDRHDNARRRQISRAQLEAVVR